MSRPGKRFRTAAEAVDNGAEEKLRNAVGDHIDDNDELTVIVARGAKLVADDPERGQHHIDGQRIQRHGAGDNGHKLNEGELGFGCNSFGHGRGGTRQRGFWQ